MKIGSKLPIIDLRENGSSIEVILITGLQKNFMLSEVLSILQEGAEVVGASFSAVGDKLFHTIHSQVYIQKILVYNFTIYSKSFKLIKIIINLII